MSNFVIGDVLQIKRALFDAYGERLGFCRTAYKARSRCKVTANRGDSIDVEFKDGSTLNFVLLGGLTIFQS